jgi:hypothetical protein
MTENQRRLINLRLQRYGGDISQYEPFMEVGYEPTVGALRSQAEGMRDYLVGLPEIMAKAMKEGEKSGVTYKSPDTRDLQADLQRRLNNIYAEFGPKITLPNTPTADTMERMAQAAPRPAQPSQGSRLRAQPTRRTGGSQVSFR